MWPFGMARWVSCCIIVTVHLWREGYQPYGVTMCSNSLARTQARHIVRHMQLFVIVPLGAEVDSPHVLEFSIHPLNLLRDCAAGFAVSEDIPLYKMP